MIEENKEATKAVEAMFAIATRMKRGETLTYETIYTITGLERSDVSWQAFQIRLRRRILSELGIATKAINNVGYYMLTNQEQVAERATHRNKKKNSQVLKALSEISAADASECPVNIQRLKASQVDKLASERRANIQNAKEIRTIVHEAMPKIAH